MMRVLRSAAHALVAYPVIYDLVQYCAGADYIHKRFAGHLRPLISKASVLDVGGGTGMSRRNVSDAKMYLCLDNDLDKLHRFRMRFSDPVIQGDAGRIPLRNGAVDLILCAFMTHHLSDDTMAAMLVEWRRILKESGRLMLIEAVYDEHNPLGKFLWRFDVGQHPRPAPELQARLCRHFRITEVDAFRVFHSYRIYVGSLPPIPEK